MKIQSLALYQLAEPERFLIIETNAIASNLYKTKEERSD